MGQVLITGVGGFVGSHVLQAILDRTDHQVIGIESWRHNGAVENAEQAIVVPSLDVADRWNRTRILTHDLTAPFSARTRARLDEVTHVVSVASRCHVGDSIDEPAEFVRNNVNLMVELLEWCREHKPQQILHVSTDEVYGPGSFKSGFYGSFKSGFYDRHVPSSPYAASKAMQEDLCLAYQTTYGLPITILNSANMFGERQSLLAFIPRVLRAVVLGEEIDIHTINGKPGTRWYTYVRNVAARISTLVQQSRPLGDRILLQGQQRFDVLELALLVAELAGRELRYRFVDGQAVRPGWDPSYAPLPSLGTHWAENLTTVDDALRATVSWALADTSWMHQ